MSITVRISKKNKEEIDQIADQLGTSVKEVIDMILTFFLDTDWGNPDLIGRFYEEEEE